MPREIADSDAESDLDSPRRPSASPIPENTHQAPPPSTLEEDPFANIEFDQFLSPTQRLSSAVEQQDVIASRSTTSTDIFLQEIAQTDHRFINGTSHSNGLDGSFEHDALLAPRHMPKRTLSEIERVQSRSGIADDIQQKALKRTKTYGSSRSQKSDSISLFSDTLPEHRREIGYEIQEQAREDSETTSAELPIKPLVNPAVSSESHSNSDIYNSGPTRAHHQRGATSFLQSNIQNSFITRNTIGGYTGINMDFRGSGLGLETDTNPFGSLSQVSLDGDIDPAEAEKFTSLFRHSQQSDKGGYAEDMHDSSTFLRPSHLNEMATSPVEGLHDGEQISSKHDNEVDQEISAKSAQKKRGRKPKNAQDADIGASNNIDGIEVLQVGDPSDIPQEQYKPRSTRSRAGTIDSVTSRLSQMSETTGASNRKRKRSAHPEDASGKQLSSELNLSDPAMIGAPRELYVPRPSKSRSRRVIEDQDDDVLQNDEHGTSTPRAVPHGSPSDEQNVQIVQPAAVANTKKKTGRKSKVKRAKTSAAVTIKSPDMYDDDDKDCIVVDEIPAKVKMDALPETSHAKQADKDKIKGSKREESERPEDEDIVEKIQKLPSEVKISVDIPKLSAAKQAEAVAVSDLKPKKRGRKPKKKAELHQDEDNKGPEPGKEPDNDVETQSTEASLDSRAALSEKDPNTATPPPLQADQSTDTMPASKEEPPSPEKRVHSPLKPTSTRASTPATVVASSNVRWVKPRVGLSRRTTIPSLLRKLDRSKEPPRVLERKEKLSKRQQEEQDRQRLEAEDAGEDFVERWAVRGKDGMLLEWDE